LQNLDCPGINEQQLFTEPPPKRLTGELTNWLIQKQSDSASVPQIGLRRLMEEELRDKNKEQLVYDCFAANLNASLATRQLRQQYGERFISSAAVRRFYANFMEKGDDDKSHLYASSSISPSLHKKNLPKRPQVMKSQLQPQGGISSSKRTRRRKYISNEEEF